MKIESIVKELNHLIELERNKYKIPNNGFFIIHKTIIPNKLIKAIKEVSMILWYVNPEENIKEQIIIVNKCCRILTGQEEGIIEEVSKEMIFKIFQFIRLDYFDNIIRGKYGRKLKEITE